MEVLSASVDAAPIRPCARAATQGRECRREKRARERPVCASAREWPSGGTSPEGGERLGVDDVDPAADALKAAGRWPLAAGRWHSL